MVGFKQLFRRLPLFSTFVGFSLAFGLMVPTIFEWGEKPASRSRHPEMVLATIIVVVVTLLIAAVTFYVRKSSERSNPDEVGNSSRPPLHFGVGGLLIVTTLTAVLLAVSRFFESELASLAVVVVAAGSLTFSLWTDWQVRSRIGSLVAVLFLPFFWMILYNKPFGYASGLIESLPIGPAVLMAALTRGHLDDGSWIAASFVIVELFFGTWLARRGGKLFLSFLFFVFLFSCFNSFVLHVLYRM